MAQNPDGSVKRGRGRPVGSISSKSKQLIAEAEASGEMPHVFLLRVARGELITQKRLDPETGEIVTGVVVPDMGMRIDAAKNVSPYFAAKLATVEITQVMDDDELDSAIQQLAAEAGIGFAADGESQADEAGERPRSRVRISEATRASVTVPGQSE